jgi:hypothetical protein
MFAYETLLRDLGYGLSFIQYVFLIVKVIEYIEIEFETKDKVCLNLRIVHLEDKLCAS